MSRSTVSFRARFVAPLNIFLNISNILETSARSPPRSLSLSSLACENLEFGFQPSGTHADGALGRFENLSDGRRETFPVRSLFGQLFAAGFGQLVILGLAIVVRAVPFGDDPTLLFESIQSRVERTLVDVEHSIRHLLDALRNTPAVHRFQRQRLQDQ